MPSVNYLSKLTLNVDVAGTITPVEYTIKDAEARELIEALGHAVYWIGVTTTALTDGATTNPIQVNSKAVTATIGGMASYNGSEFVWNGTAWQELGKNNFGALAFKSSASASYTPAGAVNVTKGDDTKASITPFGTAGEAPYFTVSGETATFHAGSVPTAGTAIDVVTASGSVSATFAGTQATITVE